MSTANAPHPQQPQQTLPEPPEWIKRMIPIEKAIGILLLLYLIGPPVILYAKGTQEHAAGLAWQAEKRWAQVNGSAFLSLLLYVPIALFHGPLASCWTTLFVTFAQWFHLPWLAWFGDTSILPPLPSSILLRWVLAFPLAGLLALLIEMARPRTTWETKRIVTPEEQQEVAAMQATEEKKQLAAEKRNRLGPHNRQTRLSQASLLPQKRKGYLASPQNQRMSSSSVCQRMIHSGGASTGQRSQRHIRSNRRSTRKLHGETLSGERMSGSTG